MFQVKAKLGEQNKRKFNEVFLVVLMDGQIAVLKKMQKNDKNIHLQEFLRFEATLKFSHKNLPNTIYFEENEKEIIIVKSFFQGEPLDQYFSKLNKEIRFQFLIKLIESLIPLFNELSEKKLIHGDIKPSNIIIYGNDLNFEVYLIDFGMSFYVLNTTHRKTIFSLGYSAPELILNQLQVANQSTDIFSLGICIYYLLEGKIPLVHPNPAIMTNLQLTHPLIFSKKTPKDLQKILNKMCLKPHFKLPPILMSNEQVILTLSQSIEERYQNLEMVLIDLKQINFSKKDSWIKKLIKVFSNSKIEVKK